MTDPTPDEGDVSCEGLDDGTYLPNPRDKGSFYMCHDGVPVLHQCPDSLVFNPEINVCDWPRNVGG